MGNVPFYRDLYTKAGITPEDIRTLEDVSRLPIIDKRKLWALHPPLPKRDDLIIHRTSGSTGTPVHIYRSTAEERGYNMLRWRMLLSTGLRPGDRLAKVKATWETLPRRFEMLGGLASKLGLVEPRVFDCFQPPAETLAQLVEFQPHILTSYPGVLVKIALLLSGQDRVLDGLRKIYCGGESMSLHQRRILEESFRVPICNTYGTTECSLTAWECPESGHYHVCDDGVFVEICRDGHAVRPGQSGEVVITALHSRVMPLIRYRLGDIAVAGQGPCSCGSAFSTIESLQGRVLDYLQLPDGRQMHPFQFLNEIVLASGNWISEYQVVQDSLAAVRLKIVPRREVSAAEAGHLRSALEQELGTGVAVRIEWVDDIACDASGKFHFCRSLISEDAGNLP